MGNYEQLKQAVSDVIKANGNQEITGAILQNALLTIISTIGNNATFAGIATPKTNPGTPDQNVFWLAATKGEYSNFNAYKHDGRHIVIFKNTSNTWDAVDTGIVSIVNTFIFSYDSFGLGAYIEDIVFELPQNFDSSVFYKPNGDIRNYAIQNIDSEIDKGRVVIYQENDNGDLVRWIDNTDISWITTKNIVLSKNGITVKIFLKDVPEKRLYPLFSDNRINRNVIRKAITNLDIQNVKDAVFQEAEILPTNSRFNFESDVTSTNVGLWKIRYPGSSNYVERTSDGIKVTLNKNAGSNPGLWLINFFNDYIGKEIKFTGSIRGDSPGSIILYTNTADLTVHTIDFSTEWSEFDFTEILGSVFSDARIMFYTANEITFYIKDLSFVSNANMIKLLDEEVSQLNDRVNNIEKEISEEGIELLPQDSLLDANTNLVTSDGLNIGAGSVWEMRFPGITTNQISKQDNYFNIILDSTQNENAAFWARNLLSSYIGDEVKVKFSIKSNGVTSNVRFILGGGNDTKIITPTSDWKEYEYTMNVLNQYGDTRIMFYANSGDIANFSLKDISIQFLSELSKTLDDYNQRITTLESKDYSANIAFTENTPNVLSKIGRIIFEENGVMNIGMFGDSWTQGVGSVSTGLITYVKYFARMMWKKYGFAGHGWFDFGYSNNSDMKCADDEAISLVKSGSFDYLSKTASCLGINIAHTVFNNNASYTLQLVDETKPIDKAEIWYYEDANFSVSVNDGEAETVSGNIGGGWQSKIITSDINKIVITSLKDGSIIFGINFSYGSKGVKVHKLGNRGLTTSKPLQVNIENWKTGLSKLSLDFFSCLLFTNDRSGNVNPITVQNNIAQIMDNVKQAYPTIDEAVFTPSETKAGTGIYSISDYTNLLRDYCIREKMPFLSFSPIFGTREQIIALNTFYDSLHPSKTGDYMIAEYIFKHLFEYYQYK